MAGALPRFIVLKQYDLNAYLSFSDKVEDLGFAVLTGDSVFNTMVKIEVEPSKTGNNKFVHLRFCHSNKYLQRKDEDGLIIAQSNQPEEDTSKSSCTLFEPTILDTDQGLFHLGHVHSGGRVETRGIYLSVNENPGDDPNYYYYDAFFYRDWDTFVKLPERVAFKGDNSSYLKAYWYNSLPYLRFASGDPNNEESVHEFQLMSDGHVRIKSNHFGKFLRFGHDWIWADSGDSEGNDTNTLFWPVKYDDNTIALRSAGNNNFCRRLTADGKTDCLNASAATIINEAKLQVQELVIDRKIYNVRYRMEDARIFDEKPFAAGTTNAINRAEGESSIAVAVEYEDQRSYSFSRSMSITAGVTATIEADVLGIVDGSIEFSFEVTGAFEWANTETVTKSVTATGTVPVPGRSVSVVSYVGTVGTCNVPFSYTQQDKSSTDGRVVENEEIDGVYTGVNCYNFSFEILDTQPLPEADD
ncbi:hypothetical protein C2S53_008060 [Perilla frutescens var. hirtella]|uniref:Agglutinin domain-containing protein n=1 Tax=Perilla frutescens var. hirtella TaxID=608512 RepID=A0AAD4IQA5_PERFH|nr:hypothetical protein C2S53_008060 [Perilla frutescens var. hirtella]